MTAQPTTTTNATTETELEKRARLATLSEDLRERIAELTEQREAVTSALRELGPGPAGVHPDGTPREVVVEQSTRFDPNTAALLLPTDMLTLITSTAVDPKLAKARLAPDVYDACRTPYGKPRVTIK